MNRKTHNRENFVLKKIFRIQFNSFVFIFFIWNNLFICVIYIFSYEYIINREMIKEFRYNICYFSVDMIVVAIYNFFGDMKKFCQNFWI